MFRFIACWLLMIGFGATSLSAQKPRSTLIVRMEDGHPLTIAVNNRYYHKTGTRLTVGDVPGRRPYLQVYRFRPYVDGKGGKAERVFSGKLKIERGGTYEVIVHPDDRSVSVGRLRAAPAAYPSSAETYEATQAAIPAPVAETPKAPWLQALLDQMDAKVKDSEKLQLALSGLPERLRAAEAGRLCEGILFEDNKLRLLKAAYPKITDPENFEQVKDCLWEATSRNTLEKWLQSKD